MKNNIIISLVLILFLSSCSKAPTSYSRSEVEAMARITLPSSASSIHCGTEHGIDSLTYIRFTLPEEDLDNFIKSLKLARPLSGNENEITGSNVMLHSDMGVQWWQPELLTHKKVSDKSEPGFAWNVLAGYTEGDELNKTITVYLFNFSI